MGSEERAACMRLVKCDARLCAKGECFSQPSKDCILGSSLKLLRFNTARVNYCIWCSGPVTALTARASRMASDFVQSASPRLCLRYNDAFAPTTFSTPLLILLLLHGCRVSGLHRRIRTRPVRKMPRRITGSYSLPLSLSAIVCSLTPPTA